MRGLLFNIQRYSIHDGPGIRTVVFFKGCPLRCLYCCNPESQTAQPELEFWRDLCRHCGICISVCPRQAINPDVWLSSGPKVDRRECDACGLCVEACASRALRLVGSWYTLDELMTHLLRDAAYYRRSGGGITLSGGEPLAQLAFTAELLHACHERNIHTALETCGYVDWKVFEDVLPYVDLFLCDLKHTDDAAHRRLTGRPNDRIVHNLRRLADAGTSIILRVPLIPEHNLTESHLRRVADLAAELGVLEVHVMPLHHLARDKFRRLERPYAAERLPDLRGSVDGRASVRWACSILSDAGLSVHVGG